LKFLVLFGAANINLILFPAEREFRRNHELSHRQALGFYSAIRIRDALRNRHRPLVRDLFGALATHAGDALYEACYLAEFAQAARALRAYDHDVWAWWDAFQDRNGIWAPGDPAVITALGCSAAFSADSDGTPMLPFDPRTGVVIDDLWQRWLGWDPVRMVDDHAGALRGLHSIWIDAGKADEYYLDLGAEAFRARLDRIGVPADRVQFELVDGKHGDMHWRYPMAMQWLAGRLARD
ncbi:MAG: hypothetical protein EB027_06920, partial [Actinobacteria bacterium]|nr:hypothetical protein [Actinomycetota bacterium]